MVKKVFFFIVILTLLSCSTYKNEYGGVRPREKLTLLGGFSIKPKPSVIFKKVTLYKLKSLSKIEKKTLKVKTIASYDGDGGDDLYMIFYPNGRCQSIRIAKGNNIAKVTNLLKKGVIGFYKDVSNNEIKCERYINGDGGGLYLKENGTLDKKSIFLIRSKLANTGHLYIKTETPKSIAQLQPNW